MRYPHKILLHALTMRRAISPVAPDRTADHQVQSQGTAIHRGRFCRKVQDVIVAQCDEISKHNLDNNFFSTQRHATSDSQKRCLAQWSCQNTPGETLRQASADLKCSPVWIKKILPKQKDPGIAGKECMQ